MSEKIRITEHYLCQEGEGKTLGALTYLIRLSGCNLRCFWCDSKFSSFFNKEERQVEAKMLERAALRSNAAWVSLTGGEPTFRDEAELKALADLCHRLRKRGRKIKIESNGLLLPQALRNAADLWSIAPKWDARRDSADARTIAMRYDLARLRTFRRLYAPHRLQLKFVIHAPQDLQRIARLLGNLGPGPRPAVFFIPQAYAPGDYLLRLKSLARSVEQMAGKLSGWDLRVQPQMQRILYGDERRR